MFNYLIKCVLFDPINHSHWDEYFSVEANNVDHAAVLADEFLHQNGKLLRRVYVFEQSMSREFPFLPDKLAYDAYYLRGISHE